VASRTATKAAALKPGREAIGVDLKIVDLRFKGRKSGCRKVGEEMFGEAKRRMKRGEMDAIWNGRGERNPRTGRHF